MDLNEFIKRTLIDIAKGIKESQEEGLKLGAVINPQLSTRDSVKIKDGYYTIQKIEFEIGLTVKEGLENKSGIGVAIGHIDIGKNIKKEGNNTSVNNIKFTVPMILPSIPNDATPERYIFSKEELGLDCI